MIKSYVEPDIVYFNEKRNKFFEVLKVYQDKIISKQNLKISIDDELINKIILRLHQRKNYYLYFHKYEINQQKELAIITYWILKYKPFKSDNNWNKEYDINTHFAFHFLVYSLTSYTKIKEDLAEIKGLTLPKDLQKNYLHMFSECDISKESLMLLSESLGMYILECIKTIKNKQIYSEKS